MAPRPRVRPRPPSWRVGSARFLLSGKDGGRKSGVRRPSDTSIGSLSRLSSILPPASGNMPAGRRSFVHVEKLETEIRRRLMLPLYVSPVFQNRALAQFVRAWRQPLVSVPRLQTLRVSGPRVHSSSRSRPVMIPLFNPRCFASVDPRPHEQQWQLSCEAG